MELFTTIPTLIEKYNREQQQVMLALAKMISNGTNGYIIYEFFINKYLSMTSIKTLNVKVNGVSIQQYIEQLETQFDQIKLGLKQAKKSNDPVQAFLISAIIKGNRWCELNEQCGYHLFNSKHKYKSNWTCYDMWIICLCFKKMTKRKAIYFISSLFKIKQMLINDEIIQMANRYKKRVMAWFEMQTDKLELIYDEDLRIIFISIKNNDSLHELIEKLQLWKRLRNPNPNQIHFNHWIKFLCHQIQKKFIFQSIYLANEVKDIIKCSHKYYKYLGELTMQKYQNKLTDILSKVKDIDESFPIQLQATLLKSIKNGLTWSQTMQKLQNIYRKKQKKQNFNQEISIDLQQSQLTAVSEIKSSAKTKVLLPKQTKQNQNYNKHFQNNYSPIHPTTPTIIQKYETVMNTKDYKSNNKTNQLPQVYITSSVIEIKGGDDMKNHKNMINIQQDKSTDIQSHSTAVRLAPAQSSQTVICKQMPKKDILILSMIMQSKQKLEKIQTNFTRKQANLNLLNHYNSQKETFRLMSSNLIAFYRSNSYMIDEIKNPILKAMVSIMIETQLVSQSLNIQSTLSQDQSQCPRDDKAIHKSFIEVFKNLTDQSVTKKKKSKKQSWPLN